MTLYRQLASKDDLIAEILQREDDAVRAWMDDAVRDASSARLKLRAYFTALEKRLEDADGRGCLFQMAFGEFPEPEHAVHRIASDHKAAVRTSLRNWVEGTGTSKVDEITQALYLLAEGMWAAARERVETNGAALTSTVLVGGWIYAEALEETASGAPDASRTNRDGW